MEGAARQVLSVGTDSDRPLSTIAGPQPSASTRKRYAVMGVVTALVLMAVVVLCFHDRTQGPSEKRHGTEALAHHAFVGTPVVGAAPSLRGQSIAFPQKGTRSQKQTVPSMVNVAGQGADISRRSALATAAVGMLALNPSMADAVKATTGLSSKWTGDYTDPNHPGCQRSIKVTGNNMDPGGRKSRKPSAVIKGTDNEDGDACQDGEGESWRLTATLTEDQSKIMVDFSPKGGPKDVVGKWQDGGIVFPDGNKWTKIQQEVTTLVGKLQ